MYRGGVEQVTQQDGNTVLVVRSAVGINYKAPVMQFVLTENTMLRSQPVAGDFVEVYYGTPVEQSTADAQDVADAIAINQLSDVSVTNINGTIVSIGYAMDDSNRGRIVLALLDSDAEVVIHFQNDGTTQLYLAADALVEGATINVFTDGSATTNDVAEYQALEIRTYAD